MANIDQIATAFVQHYYTLFDTNRAGLAPLYQAESMLTFEGARIQGQVEIMKKLTTLQFATVRHQVLTIDCQPTPANGVIIFVSGNLAVDADPNPLKFSQVFHLLPIANQAGGFFVFNDLFRLNYG